VQMLKRRLRLPRKQGRSNNTRHIGEEQLQRRQKLIQRHVKPETMKKLPKVTLT
jgi:hypothetical protein